MKLQKADENGVATWCLRSRAGCCFIQDARGRRQFFEKSLRLAHIMRNLNQIYDTPIYQAWQTFRRIFSDIYFFFWSKMNLQEIMQFILQFCAGKNAFLEFYEGNP
ncbi:MAG TPA: hypothetical protein PKA81_15145 [Clostridia bacterium]|nr:hypothetical protein [Clostridia bacterium]